MTNKKIPFYKRWWFWVILVVVIGGIGMVMRKDGDRKNSESADLPYGFLEVKEFCAEYDDNLDCSEERLIIKAKNSSSAKSNFLNVSRYIKQNDVSRFEEIQYWAAGDTVSGDEIKVISFTIPRRVVERLKNEEVLWNDLENYVEDLYVHPSLE